MLLLDHIQFFLMKNFSNFKKIIELSKKDLITFESPFDGDAAIFYADILIGDYSGINLEFAALRKKQLISVDVAKKVSNENWKNLKISPIEIKIREDIGLLVPPNLKKILSAVNELEKNKRKKQSKLLI